MLKVPEHYRIQSTGVEGLNSTQEDGNNGLFIMDSNEPGWRLVIVCSDGGVEDTERWEHVSVHAIAARGKERKRVPSWKEMAYVKDLFWDAEDWVWQYHPPHSQYVNNHPYVLHLWRYTQDVSPKPPEMMVGIKDLGDMSRVHPTQRDQMIKDRMSSVEAADRSKKE